MSSKNVASLETVSLGMRLEKDLKLRSPQITQEAPNIMTRDRPGRGERRGCVQTEAETGGCSRSPGTLAGP